MTRRQALLLTTAAACARLPARPRGRPAPDLEALLARMTLDEKLGQMTQGDHAALDRRPQDVRDLALGSVLSGGDSPPISNTPSGWADLHDRYQTLALSTRLGIPLLYGVDAVHGFNGLRDATIFPHNIGLGATRDPALVEEAARITAREVAAVGIEWAFAPCLAVPRDERWGRTYEGFGESPELAELGAAAVRGLQAAAPGAPPALLACAKHFLGDGGTTGGKDQGDTAAGDEELRRLHLPGYRAAINAGVGSIMISFNSIRGQPMHGSGRRITGLLKGELGFTGFTVTDWNGIDKLAGDYRARVEAAVNAGIDMFMEPDRYRDFIATLRALVAEGRVPLARIDDAVRRILRQKAALALWSRPLADRSGASAIGNAAHRAVARRAVAASIVLLKNDRRALPIAPAVASIHVAGRRADDIGVQCGGWTAGWQGGRGPITAGTTILAAIRAGAPRARVTFSADGGGASDAEVVVAVVGEDPYAEGKGDRADLALAGEDQALVERLHRAGRPLVLVLVSGRPLILGPALAQADAVVAAWLPGSEGGGVADVLFGARPPTGKLPHSWPRSMADLPLNVGEASYRPLFPYGFGLTY
jgi:beta-glucosidase